jgi:hypothetical protein
MFNLGMCLIDRGASVGGCPLAASCLLKVPLAFVVVCVFVLAMAHGVFSDRSVANHDARSRKVGASAYEFEGLCQN